MPGWTRSSPLILYDGEADEYVAARDPIGIRPLFYGCDPDGGILFASEAKQRGGWGGVPLSPRHYSYRGRVWVWSVK